MKTKIAMMLENSYLYKEVRRPYKGHSEKNELRSRASVFRMCAIVVEWGFLTEPGNNTLLRHV